MEYRKFEHTFVIRLDPGEEILTSLTQLCKKEGIRLASVTGLGAAGTIELGVYDTEKKQYYSYLFTMSPRIVTNRGCIRLEGDNKGNIDIIQIIQKN